MTLRERLKRLEKICKDNLRDYECVKPCSICGINKQYKDLCGLGMNEFAEAEML